MTRREEARKLTAAHKYKVKKQLREAREAYARGEVSEEWLGRLERRLKQGSWEAFERVRVEYAGGEEVVLPVRFGEDEEED